MVLMAARKEPQPKKKNYKNLWSWPILSAESIPSSDFGIYANRFDFCKAKSDPSQVNLTSSV